MFQPELAPQVEHMKNRQSLVTHVTHPQVGLRYTAGETLRPKHDDLDHGMTINSACWNDAAGNVVKLL